MVLSGVDLSSANLSGADLRGAVMDGADLTSVDLSGANLNRADLRNARLEHANLSGANLTGTALRGAELTNLISIDGADFTDAKGLSKESTEYLSSIARGSHPVTSRQTTETIGFPNSEMVEDRA